jgi:hypothetical protein
MYREKPNLFILDWAKRIAKSKNCEEAARALAREGAIPN